MTARKRFVPDEVLLAEDINDGLNPFTAAHIPFAVAAGSLPVSAVNTDERVTAVPLPAGRFTRAPIIMLTVYTSASWGWAITARVGNPLPTTFNLITRPSVTVGSVPVSFTVFWVAIQMTDANGAG